MTEMEKSAFVVGVVLLLAGLLFFGALAGQALGAVICPGDSPPGFTWDAQPDAAFYPVDMSINGGPFEAYIEIPAGPPGEQVSIRPDIPFAGGGSYQIKVYCRDSDGCKGTEGTLGEEVIVKDPLPPPPTVYIVP